MKLSVAVVVTNAVAAASRRPCCVCNLHFTTTLPESSSTSSGTLLLSATVAEAMMTDRSRWFMHLHINRRILCKGERMRPATVTALRAIIIIFGEWKKKKGDDDGQQSSRRRFLFVKTKGTKTTRECVWWRNDITIHWRLCARAWSVCDRKQYTMRLWAYFYYYYYFYCVNHHSKLPAATDSSLHSNRCIHSTCKVYVRRQCYRYDIYIVIIVFNNFCLISIIRIITRFCRLNYWETLWRIENTFFIADRRYRHMCHRSLSRIIW
jgi:hypothetical protein